MKEHLTDEQVEQEIERLKQSPLVKLAKKEEMIRYRRRQYLYKLKGYEKKGKALADRADAVFQLTKPAPTSGSFAMRNSPFFKK